MKIYFCVAHSASTKQKRKLLKFSWCSHRKGEYFAHFSVDAAIAALPKECLLSAIMDKENVIHELFMAMKVSLKNASRYNPEHPAFKKTVEEMKERMDVVFEFMDPIEIDFSPHVLLVDDNFWD